MNTALMVIVISVVLGIGCMVAAGVLFWRSSKRAQAWWDAWMP